MASIREMRMRISSVRNISQVTRAMQAVSASKVRKSQQAVEETRPYATRAWFVLQHLATQPGRETIHPLLDQREKIKQTMVILLTGDRGLAGAYNANVIRFAMEKFRNYSSPVKYVLVGKEGREPLLRMGVCIQAEFSELPDDISYSDVSAIGRLAVDEFLDLKADEVFVVYTDFVNMLSQIPTLKKLLPLEFDSGTGRVSDFAALAEERKLGYLYEPGQDELLDTIIPSFTSLQLYQAVLESIASEHAARMVAMQNATDNALELVDLLQLEYNKARQQTITREMLDIVGGTLK
ncbi:MAG: ATP synthase F1 subunit gamma [Anaerolineales bacterium]|nr:ATP synthase F1 subunit gamma [Anaerolineales bacterium]